ncbi:nuclear transport factor 2 family protein [Dyadobacter frigoris]|nr:nuclear transport factor 2 family protein [Dyadobacter frigoris]GLU52663.1 bile-acid 7-alpha-dehydratase [Dyadobacter frigoris]
MADQETTIKALQETENIKKPLARYCRFLDTKQWTAFGELLTEDVQLTFKDTAGNIIFQFYSRKEMLDLTAPMLQSAVTIHYVNQPEITVLSETEASAIWALEDQIIFPEGTAGAPYRAMHGFGIYHQTLKKSDKGWQISSFILDRLKLDITN